MNIRQQEDAHRRIIRDQTKYVRCLQSCSMPPSKMDTWYQQITTKDNVYKIIKWEDDRFIILDDHGRPVYFKESTQKFISYEY